MTTKKLSEIGREMWAEQREFDWKLVVSFLDEKIADSDVPFYVYTPADRRDLVKASINAWESFKWHRGFKDGKLPTFEEFCEEQGI